MRHSNAFKGVLFGICRGSISLGGNERLWRKRILDEIVSIPNHEEVCCCCCNFSIHAVEIREQRSCSGYPQTDDAIYINRIRRLARVVREKDRKRIRRLTQVVRERQKISQLKRELKELKRQEAQNSRYRPYNIQILRLPGTYEATGQTSRPATTNHNHVFYDMIIPHTYYGMPPAVADKASFQRVKWPNAPFQPDASSHTRITTPPPPTVHHPYTSTPCHPTSYLLFSDVSTSTTRIL
ncbi:uncharacterized protein LOC124899144 [Capsicum annuum]|uniref:uncharacterized protein LOC124899144 n=1 Tax=Capsicum annuum TaxID=4072 RepID=UPI001FB13587|nr:uncharacterized protein LOC124899144 [Capsicum annuum]